MERLTSYEGDYKREMICRYEDCDTLEEYCPDLNTDNCPCLQEILERLAEYEDLEEQGKLLKLPCAVGIQFIGFALNVMILIMEVAKTVHGKIVVLTEDALFMADGKMISIRWVNALLFRTRFLGITFLIC